MGKRMGAFLLLIILIILMPACGTQHDTAGYISESENASDENIYGTETEDTASLVSGGSNLDAFMSSASVRSTLSSDLPEISVDDARRELLTALEKSNSLKSFNSSESVIFRVGTSEIQKVMITRVSALENAEQICLSTEKAVYQDESAENSDGYEKSIYQHGKIMTTNTLAVYGETSGLNEISVIDDAKAVTALPGEYSAVGNSMIIAVDSLLTDTGASVYSFTMSTEETKNTILDYITPGQKQVLLKNGFTLEHNVLTAKINANGYLVEAGNNIKVIYYQNGVKKSGELLLTYSCSKLGSSLLPEKPGWAK